MRNIRENLVFAFAYNAIGIPIAAGVLYPAFAPSQSDRCRTRDVAQLRVGDRERTTLAHAEALAGLKGAFEIGEASKVPRHHPMQEACDGRSEMDYVKFIYRPLRHAQHIMSWSVEIARGSQQIGVAYARRRG